MTINAIGQATDPKWFESLAVYLEKIGPREAFNKKLRWGGRRMIMRDNAEGIPGDYLERFYVLSTKWLGIYLHRFWDSDEDGLHDHPWNSASILLDGVYYEEEPERQCVPYGPTLIRERRPLHPPIKLRTKNAAHRITIDENNPGAWSLFIRFGLKRREWGFYRDRKWSPAPVQSRDHEKTKI